VDGSSRSFHARSFAGLAQIVQQADSSLRRVREKLVGQAMLGGRYITDTDPGNALGEIENAWCTVGEDDEGLCAAGGKFNIEDGGARWEDRNLTKTPL
jgi:hypothetical protein